MMLAVLAALTCFEPKILISRKGWLLGSTWGRHSPGLDGRTSCSVLQQDTVIREHVEHLVCC